MMKLRHLAALAVLALACGDPTSPEARIAGTYTLVSAGGQTVPYTFVSRQDAFTVYSGQYVLRADGTYHYSITTDEEFFFSPSPGKRTDTGDGRFSVRGTAVWFDEQGQAIGQLDRIFLTLNGYRYQRE